MPRRFRFAVNRKTNLSKMYTQVDMAKVSRKLCVIDKKRLSSTNKNINFSGPSRLVRLCRLVSVAVGRTRVVREEGIRIGPHVGVSGRLHQTPQQDPPWSAQGV